MEQAKTAVLAIHGMGQQVPYETLGTVAQAIRTHAEFREANPGMRASAQNVRHLGRGPDREALIPRIRLAPSDPDAGAGPAVDVYECYWANITAGQVGLLDALAFLAGSGIQGILYSFGRVFSRYFWKGERDFRLPAAQNVATLLAILLGLSGLAAVGSRLYLGFEGAGFLRPLEELAFLFRVLHFVAVPVLILFAARGSRNRPRPATAGLLLLAALAIAQIPGVFHAPDRAWPRFVAVRDAHARLILQIAIVADVISVMINCILRASASFRSGGTGRRGPGLSTLIIWSQAVLGYAAVAAAGFFSASFTWKAPAFAADGLGSVPMLIAYGAVGLAALAGLRYFLIEYVGDLAAYLSAHKASKFCGMREKIQEEAFAAAAHLYASGYDHILILGHSLGSVIAYDTLNAVFNRDAILEKEWDAARRTKLLLTFGSPLDKVAFVFRVQVQGNALRELLAAAKQPMLAEDHRFRPREWINVWSRNDIISGPLDFFDVGEHGPRTGNRKRNNGAYRPYADQEAGPLDIGPAVPGPAGGPVISKTDPRADLPFAAHNQYWENPMIYDELVRVLNACMHPPSGPEGPGPTPPSGAVPLSAGSK